MHNADAEEYDSDDSVISGFQADSADLPPPPAIVNLFIRQWPHHFSMATIIDSACATAQTARRLGPTATSSSAASAEFINPTVPELKLTYDEWHQGWRRLFNLLKEHMPRHYARWKIHFDYINSRPNRAQQWPAWLAYDTQVHTLTRSDKRIDVRTFQKAIWEDVITDHLTKIAEGTAASNAQASSSSRANPSRNNRGGTRTYGSTNNGPANSSSSGPGRTAAPQPRSLVDPSSSNAQPKATGRSTAEHFVTATTAPVVHAPASDANGTPTSAPSAAPPPTMPRAANEDPRRVVTPLLPEAWRQVLLEHDLLDKFADVPPGLSNGFPIGSLINITRTSVPDNHSSARDNPTVVERAISSEVAAGRYSGPYTRAELESLIGPFRSAPLGVVEKSTPGEFRIIQDFSFPRDSGDHPALNAEINPDDYMCEWGYFDDVALAVILAPPGTEAATMDVDAAYRRMPIRTADQHNIVVAWKDQFWVDHCVPFGATSSNGIFGRCGDAMAHICAARNLGPVFKWVDDFLFFRFPSQSDPSLPAYTVNDIIAIAVHLGWPWKLSKTRDFCYIFVYLGFEWNLRSRTVRIPEPKREKYLKRLQNWLARKRVSLHDTETLVGSLAHCTQVVTAGRPRLAGLHAFITAFANTANPGHWLRTPSSRAREDAEWWLHTLTSDPLSRPLRPTHPDHERPAFMDASTSFGIGVIAEGCVAAWKLEPGWRRPGIDIGWAEMIAVELALTVIAATGLRRKTVLFRSDNKGVVFALKAHHSRNPHQNNALMRILALAETYEIDIRVEYIRSADNPADQPSRGIIPPHLPPVHWPICIPPELSGTISHII